MQVCVSSTPFIHWCPRVLHVAGRVFPTRQVYTSSLPREHFRVTLRCWLPLPRRLPIASRARRSSPHCLPRRCRPSPGCCSNSNPHSLRCSSRPTWVPQSLRPPRARLLVQAWALEPMEANLEQSCCISSDCLGTPVVSASNTQVQVHSYNCHSSGYLTDVQIFYSNRSGALN